MAEINLGNENEINVNISTDTNIGATVPDINYIPGYQVAEEERRANEVIRQQNETNRIALYEDMENKLATGYFDGVGLNYDWEGTSLGVKREDESEYSYTDLKGDTGNDGVSPSASVTRGTGSATITVTDASGTTTAVIYDGEKGDKGDKGDPGEVNIIVVEELPATGVEDTIYLVPLAEPDVQGNNYAEYIYINGAWELLGKVGIATDLTDYVKNTDYASENVGGVIKWNSANLFSVSPQTGKPMAVFTTYDDYLTRGNSTFISKGTLENVFTGKGFIDKNVNNLTNYTKTSDLSAVATSGSYTDLSNKPTIPDELADLTDDSTHRLVTDTDKTNWNNKVDSNGNATTTQSNVSSATITNTLEAPLLIDLKGNTSQTGTPTPSSPIPVNVVSGDNDIVVCGKNIANIYLGGLQKGDSIEVNDITYTINNDGTISGSGTATANSNFVLFGAWSGSSSLIPIDRNKTYYLSNNSEKSGNNDAGFFYIRVMKYVNGVPTYASVGNNTSFSGYDYINFIMLTVANGQEVNFNDKWIQIEEGNQATQFEEYNGTTYNIDLPEGMELNKIGTYQDYIYKENDKWYLHKEIGKVVLDGSESDSDYNTGTTGNFTRFGYIPFMNTSLVKVQSDYVSNYFKYLGTIGGDTTEAGISNTSIANLNRLFIFLPTSTASTISAFKNWLSTHNTTINYILATPTNTEITYTPLIEQLNTLEEAQSKEGTTNINQVNNDLPFIIDATVFNDNYNGRYRSLKYMYDKLKETIE